LEGFRLFLQFLIDQEADYLCGASLRVRTPRRTNYRMGSYARKLRTPIGEIPLSIPHLMYFHPRVSMVKRACRLAPEVLERLARILRGAGCQPADGEATLLISLLWTLALPDALHAELTAKLTPLLERWRNASSSEFRVQSSQLENPNSHHSSTTLNPEP